MEHYTKRLLNPFNGTVQVIADTEIRALSFNARDWELQFRCDSPKGVRYARIGTWCRQTGFKPYPLPPDIDVAAVEIAHSKMLGALQAAPALLVQDDTYELWLLDQTQQLPLALLASCRHQDEMSAATVRALWKAVTSNQLQLANTPEEERRGAPPVSYRVEECVKSRAGQNPRAAWFQRLPDRSAYRVQGDVVLPECLPAEHFPEFLLREDWKSATEQALCHRYLQRLSPRLLVLQHLSHAARDRLEQMACHYALDVADYFHLYPDIADQQRMTALRVEARLRSSLLPD